MDEEKREIVNEEQEKCEGEGGSPAGCGCYRRWLTKEFWRGILLPWSQGDDDVHLADVPVAVKALCGISLFLMLNQVRFPFFGGRLALSDLGFLLGFIPVFVYSLRQKRPFFLPLMSFAVVLAAVGIGGVVGRDVAVLVWHRPDQCAVILNVDRHFLTL